MNNTNQSMRNYKVSPMTMQTITEGIPSPAHKKHSKNEELKYQEYLPKPMLDIRSQIHQIRIGKSNEAKERYFKLPP
jgi:hypothetical protein